MPEPEIVKVATSADLLRLVPALAGVAVSDSLVLVLFRGKRTAGAMRMNLPHTDDPRVLKRWASEVVGLACRAEGTSGVVPIVYTPETFAPTGRPPAAAALRTVARRCRQAGLEVKDRLCVAADAWASLDDPAMPRGGRPLEEIASPVGPPPPREAPPVEPAPPSACDAFGDDVEAWWTRAEGPGGTLHGVDLRRPGAAFGRAARGRPAMERYRFGEDVDQVVELVERMLDPHAEGGRPCACHALLYAIALRPGLPGMVLAQLATDREVGRRIWVAANAGRPEAEDLDLLFRVLRGDHRRPDRDRLGQAIGLLRRIEGLAPAGARAPVTAMHAWLQWACGAGSIAGRLAERALAEDPGHELAAVVLNLTDGGALPAWAFSEDPTDDPWAVPAA